MASYSVGIVGTGHPEEGTFAVAYGHGRAYSDLDQFDLVACTDLVEENAQLFADEFDIDADRVYTDHETMLESEDLDFVGVCTPHNAHTDIVIDVAATPSTRAIHCEKPMALTWGDCRLIAQECWRRDIQLTFNHQRRFGDPFRKAKSLVDDGEIGQLQRVEFSIGDLFTYGSHSFDLSAYFNDDHVAEWVVGQIDYRTRHLALGSHNENQAFAQWRYENGVYGIAATGAGHDMIDAHNRLVGSNGVIELKPETNPVTECRIRREGDDEWEVYEFPADERTDMQGALADAVDALENDREPELSARKALNSTEVIFGIWESARRRGRVDFPLEIDDNPLHAMVESGQLQPEESEG